MFCSTNRILTSQERSRVVQPELISNDLLHGDSSLYIKVEHGVGNWVREWD